MPLLEYERPSVITETTFDAQSVNLLGLNRLAVLIGEGQEFFSVFDTPLIRGSSATSDVPVVEDLSSQVDGVTDSFTLTWLPVVDRTGTHTTTTNPFDITVLLDGVEITPTTLDGVTGVFTLPQIPASGSTLEVDYLFTRADTLVESEDLTAQTDGSTAIFYTNNRPIVIGDGSGTATVDPADITVLVDGLPATVATVEGSLGRFTLASAPAEDATLVVTYYYNIWQNTFDLLPVDNISTVVRVGNFPGQPLYTNGEDFTIIDGKIFWGNAAAVRAGSTSVGGTVWDETQISLFTEDTQILFEEASGTVDGSNKTFTIANVPTDGNGRVFTEDNSVIYDIPTNDPTKAGPDTSLSALVRVYVGDDIPAALAGGVVEIGYIDGANRTIFLSEDATAPSGSNNVYVSYYTNKTFDEDYTLEVTGVDTFSIYAETLGEYVPKVEYTAEAATNFASITEIYTPPLSPLQAAIGSAVDEVVTIDFDQGNNYEFTVTNVTTANGANDPLGSGGATGIIGYVNQTYVDPVTGLTFTLVDQSISPTVDGETSGNLPGTGAWVSGDTVTITVTVDDPSPADFDADGTPIQAVPGISFSSAPTATAGVLTGDTAILSTFDKGGSEPNVGDVYYISYEYPKDESGFDPLVFTKIEDVIASYGPVTTGNPLSLAAFLAFQNGAPAVGCVQVARAPGAQKGTVPDYVAALNKLKTRLPGNLNADLIVPLLYDDTLAEEVERHVDIMSSSRYQRERVSYMGFTSGTTIERARSVALNYNNVRVTFVYPDSYVVILEDNQGFQRESLVDGYFAAAAYAGLQTDPRFDVATPMTNKNLVGFSRVGRLLDPVQMNQLATAGLTIVEDLDPRLIIRHALTTNVNGVLEREQNIIWIVHFVQRQARANLQKFIGRKRLPKEISNIQATLSSLLGGLVDAEVLQDYRNVQAEADATDPTQVNVQAQILPVFAINYIVVKFSLRQSF